jgi:hypothetical protein
MPGCSVSGALGVVDRVVAGAADHVSDGPFAACACLVVVQADDVAHGDHRLGADEDREGGPQPVELVRVELISQGLERCVEQFEAEAGAQRHVEMVVVERAEQRVALKEAELDLALADVRPRACGDH